MNTPKNELAVATYDWHTRTERAVVALQRAGCNMQRISVVGRCEQDQDCARGFLDSGERAQLFDRLGPAWGALPVILRNSAAVFVPVRGYIFALGAVAAAKIGSLESAFTSSDFNALRGAMSAIGIPKESLSRYETALHANEFILVAHGDEQDVQRVGELIEISGLVSFDHLHGREVAWVA